MKIDIIDPFSLCSIITPTIFAREVPEISNLTLWTGSSLLAADLFRMG